VGLPGELLLNDPMHFLEDHLFKAAVHLLILQLPDFLDGGNKIS